VSYVDLLTDAAIADVARSVITYDQYDDWLPDPVYYEDIRPRLAQSSLIASMVRKAPSNLGHIESFHLPRFGPSTLRGIALPFGLRIQTNAAAVRIALKTRAALPRDFVKGFRFRADGPQRFSSPGEGIAWVDGSLTDEVLFGNALLALVTDVEASSEKMRWDRLSSILLGLGADAEDVAIVGRCYGRGPGLPSGDDAWSFLLNYYFRPIDKGLIARGVKFYRVRDEYITFEPAHANVVRQLLQVEGFKSVSTRLRGGPIIEKLSDLCDDAVRAAGGGNGDIEPDISPPNVEFDVLESPSFIIKGTAECDPQSGGILSDKQELHINNIRDFAAHKAIDLLHTSLGARPDAIEMAPLLRTIWSSRRTSVMRLKASDGGAGGKYLAAMIAAKPSINGLLAKSLTADTAWFGHVSAVLMSDMGPLDAPSTQGLVAYAQSPSAVLKGAAARATLARSSALGAERILARGFPMAAHPILRRWDGLTALYLAKRGVSHPFDQWLAACRTGEPALAAHLTAVRSLPA
jgi:hypothetical protein